MDYQMKKSLQTRYQTNIKEISRKAFSALVPGIGLVPFSAKGTKTLACAICY